MTIKNIKNAFERFHHHNPMEHGHYGGQNGYNFHPPPNYHAPPHVFKHYSFSQSTGSGGHKGGGSAAMSALTLLSFLFFLNILQQCLKDHMMTLNPQVTIMTASREEPQLKNMDEMKADVQQTGKRNLGDGIGSVLQLKLNDDAEQFEDIQLEKGETKPSEKTNKIKLT